MFVPSLVCAICFGSSLAVAQPVGEKDAKPRILKNDSTLPEGARLRLGSIGGYRYAGNVSAATLSHDGTRLAVVGSGVNTGITIIDVTNGKQVQTLEARLFGNSLSGMSFSADGSTLAVQTFAQDLRVFEIATGKQLQQFQHRDVGANRNIGPSMSRDGKIVGVGSENFIGKKETGEVKAFDVATGKPIGPFESIHNYNIRTAIAPDGKSMISWGQHLNRGAGAMNRDAPRTLQVWDLAAGKELRKIVLEFGPQGGMLSSVAYAPDGKTIAVASGVSTFHLLDFETGKEIRRFAGHRGQGGTTLRFSPDGEILAAHDLSGTLQAWNIKSGQRLELNDGPKSQLLAVGFPGKGRVIALGNLAQTLHWWDATADAKADGFSGHLTPISALAYTPDGKAIVTVGSDQRIFWWDANTGTQQRGLRLVDDDVRYVGAGQAASIALAPDGRYAATLSNAGNGGVRLWNLKTGRAVCDFEGPASYTQAGIAFSTDSSKLASSGLRSPVHLWDIRTGQELSNPTVDKAMANLAGSNASRTAFSPDGKLLAVHLNQYDRLTGLPVSDLILWDIANSKELNRIKVPMPNAGNVGSTGGLAFSVDSKMLAVSDGSGSILLLTAAGKELRRLTTPYKNSNFQIAFSSDGRFLATGSASRFVGIGANLPVDTPTVEVWELASGDRRETFTGHTGGITCLAFAPDGATLASGSMDTTTLLWDFTGKHGPKAAPFAANELPAIWKSLTAKDEKMSLTLRRLAATPQTLAFLKENFAPVKGDPLDERSLDKLVRDLDSTNFKARETASKELLRMGERAEAALQKGLKESKSLELRRRIQDLLAGLVHHQITPEELQAMRAVEVLERMGTPEARAWLEAVAKGDPFARATEEARGALERMARK
jgi:WD40 repeat protein